MNCVHSCTWTHAISRCEPGHVLTCIFPCTLYILYNTMSGPCPKTCPPTPLQAGPLIVPEGCRSFFFFFASPKLVPHTTQGLCDAGFPCRHRRHGRLRFRRRASAGHGPRGSRRLHEHRRAGPARAPLHTHAKPQREGGEGGREGGEGRPLFLPSVRRPSTLS